MKKKKKESLYDIFLMCTIIEVGYASCVAFPRSKSGGVSCFMSFKSHLLSQFGLNYGKT